MIAESAAQGDILLQEAQGALRADSRVTSMLGSDVAIGATFSSSSSNVNGASSLMLQCQCQGSSGNGIVAIRGEGAAGQDVRVTSLQLQVNGQVIDVPTLRGGGGGGGAGGGGNGVIDVEVIQ